MYCPNCGKENSTEQKYCRACGLELEKIVQSMIELEPKKANANLQKRKELFDRLGIFSLSSFLVLSLSYLFYKVIYYKLILFGAGILEAFAVAFLFIFGLLTVFFFNYHKFFGENPANLESRESKRDFAAKETAKLLEEKFVEPVQSVTENSTELLYTKNKTQKLR